MAQENAIKVRNVWASNLVIEFCHIKMNVGRYPLASIKCKHFLHCSEDLNKDPRASPELVYDFLKTHIPNLPLIQLGITLFDSEKKLPVIEGHPAIWIFNFNMSDSCYCPNSLSKRSLEVLELGGVDLEVNKKNGVDPAVFREIVIPSNILRGKKKITTWVSFMAMYDFGYLIKIFTDTNKFPESADELRKTAASLFGDVYDVKDMAQLLEIEGSLEDVKEKIGIVAVGGSEKGNVGLDSHLTMQVYTKLKSTPMFDRE